MHEQATARDLRYPIGPFQAPDAISEAERQDFVQQIEDAPRLLRKAVVGLSEAQLDETYRPGGWTVRQVVHHVPDSHINAYVRFKLSLTENNPTIKPYEEALWAELADTRSTPIEVSLALLENLHRRWVNLLRAMRAEDWERTYFHPGMQRSFRLDTVAALYAWHGRHHVGHITALRKRNGW